MPYFSTAGDRSRLHYVDYGPGDGPVIVFITSTYFGTEIWERQMVPLAEQGYRCVSFDRRGHGRSADVWDGFDLDTLADDVAAFIAHLDVRDVTLVGHSIGSAEAVRYLTRHGQDRVSRIALVAGMAPGIAHGEHNPDGLTPEQIAVGRAVVRGDRWRFFDEGADGFFGVGLPGIDVSPSLVRHFAARCAVATARAAFGLFDIVAGMDLSKELTQVTVPALVVHGTHDESAPVELTGRRAAELLPDAAFHLYDNAAHGLVLTHAERLNADLVTFIEQ